MTSGLKLIGISPFLAGTAETPSTAAGDDVEAVKLGGQGNQPVKVRLTDQGDSPVIDLVLTAVEYGQDLFADLVQGRELPATDRGQASATFEMIVSLPSSMSPRTSRSASSKVRRRRGFMLTATSSHSVIVFSFRRHEPPQLLLKGRGAKSGEGRRW
jgi:hypothetical protein